MNKQKKAAILWASENRGALTRIAEEVKPEVSPQFVQMVLRGLRKSKDGQIERALKEAGAPIQ